MKNMKHLIAAVLIACGCIYASQAYASVCFLPSGDCGDSGVNPDDYIPDSDALKTKCTEAGYTVAKSDCVDPKKIGDFCPYDNKWVICCAPEFTNQCDSTNEIAERCGNLVKCVCPDKFDYYESGDNCIRFSNGSSYTNARGDRNKGICYLREYKNNAFVTTSLYQGCLCNATTYPRTPEICQQKGMKPGGIMCQDAPDGDEHYSKCVCEQTTLKSSCSYGIPNNATTCTDEDGLQYVSECCQCNQATYPYDTLPSEVKTYVKCTTERSCSGGSRERYRATSCNSGYALNDAGKCVKETCANAIKELLKVSPTDISSRYGLLTATGVIDGNGNTSNATKAIVADNVTITTAGTNGSSSSTKEYCIKRECQNASGPQPNYPNDPSCYCRTCGIWQRSTSSYGGYGDYYTYEQWYFNQVGATCNQLEQAQTGDSYYGCNKDNNGYGNTSKYLTAVCTQTTLKTTTTTQAKGLVGSNATEYISASEFLQLSRFNDNPIADNAKNNCSGMPIITYKASTFPSNDSAGATSIITFKDVELNFPSTVSFYRRVVINNGALTVDGTLNDHGFLSLYGEGEVNISGILNIHKNFSASGYSFNKDSSYFGRGTLVDISPYNISNNAITLGDGQTFAVGNFQIGNSTDTYRSRTTTLNLGSERTCRDTKHLGSASTINKTFYFYGPSSSSPASVYTNLQLGWTGSGSYRAKGLSLRLSNALDWYLYNPNSSASYTIGLTGGSKIYTSDNNARILQGRNIILKKCSMQSSIIYQRETHAGHGWFGKCSCSGTPSEQEVTDTAAYFACKINKNNSLSTDGYSLSTQICDMQPGNCSYRKTYINQSCQITYERCSNRSRSPVTLLTCE